MPVDVTPPALRIAFYGDDFTGSTDTLATLTSAGLSAILFLGVPTVEQLADAGPLNALGIAGAARSMPPAAMRDELEPVGRFFSSLPVPVIHYKTCSTFDSSQQVGSIGVAVKVLRRFVSNAFVGIVGGQPNLNRYCVFANLFAAVETGGHVVRIDRHPTMRAHPVTPMHEADLRLHLAAQGMAQIVNVDYTTYDRPEAAQDANIDRILADRPDAVLFDIGHPAHLPAVGRILWQRALRSSLLAVGSSGVTQALLGHWACDKDHPPALTERTLHARIAPAEGPVFVLAGSLSPVTAGQLEAASSYRREPLAADRVLANDTAYMNAWSDRVGSLLRDGHSVLAHTTPNAGSASAAAPDAAPTLATACGCMLARLLQSVPLRRVGIAGGDTSSHALKALDIWGLSYLGNLAPGVALCRAHSRAAHLDGIEFMLKGGQMGPVDLFERLLRGS